MCDVDDNWADKAMKDATLVANLLLQIKNTTTTTTKTTTTKTTTTSSRCFNVKWTVRQRRSRFNRQVRVYNNKTEKPTRASPTTPLSWTAAASQSGTASGSVHAAAVVDGSEESSRLIKTVNTSRSNKIDEQNETATANKRSRKKRSLPELLEEEKSLLKERRTLKDELASMHLTLEKQRAKNESLKKLELDLVSQQSSSSIMVSGKAVLGPPQLVSQHSDSSKPASPQQTVQENVINDELVVRAANTLAQQDNTSAQQGIRNQEQEPLFLLPDLNLPPEEEFDENS